MKIVMKILMSTCKILCLLVVFMNSLLLDGKSRYSGIAEDEDGNILFGYLLAQYETMERDTQIVT